MANFVRIVPRHIAQGDQVVVLGNYTWKVNSTGRTFSSNWAHVSTLKDGKIVRFREYTDTAAGAAALASTAGIGAERQADDRKSVHSSALRAP